MAARPKGLYSRLRTLSKDSGPTPPGWMVRGAVRCPFCGVGKTRFCEDMGNATRQINHIERLLAYKMGPRYWEAI